MTRKAYHRLKLIRGGVTTVIEGPVVCIFDDDTQQLLSHHPLRGEEPMTEWIGGEMVVRVKSEE